MRRINAAVIFVLLLFALIYGTTMFLVVVPWLSFSVPGIFHGALLSVITAMALWCYLKCVFQDPGMCSLDWRPDEEATDSLIPVKKDGGPRHCRKCVPPRPKPPRAHHCKECNRCILRMDHHCVWVNNCVGHLNYKAFILFLMYALLSCVHCLGLLFAHTLYSMHGKHREKAALRAAVRLTENRHSAVSASANFAVMAAILQMTCISLLMPLCIALAILFGWHMYLVVKNLSTIEFYEGIRTAKRQERSAEQTKYHPYDLGVADNVLQVLGPHPSRWCCPGNGSLVGSGYVYPTNFES